jgi:hypothetical protein
VKLKGNKMAKIIQSKEEKIRRKNIFFFKGGHE